MLLQLPIPHDFRIKNQSTQCDGISFTQIKAPASQISTDPTLPECNCYQNANKEFSITSIKQSLPHPTPSSSSSLAQGFFPPCSLCPFFLQASSHCLLLPTLTCGKVSLGVFNSRAEYGKKNISEHVQQHVLSIIRQNLQNKFYSILIEFFQNKLNHNPFCIQQNPFLISLPTPVSHYRSSKKDECFSNLPEQQMNFSFSNVHLDLLSANEG